MLDALIVGGGPAGASTAFQLARLGARVRVLERGVFPREKPCAECLSPQASRLLHDMGVLDTLESSGAQLRGMMVRAPDGGSAHGDYAAAHGFRAFRDFGLAVRREILDARLLEAAQQAGAEVEHGARVTDLLRGDDDGAIIGVRGMKRSGEAWEAKARMVIGADGLLSVVARRLKLARRLAWPRRLALVAHYEGVRECGAYGEMHIERDGFVGIADVGDGVTTVAAVFPASRAAAIAGNASSYLDRWLASKAHLASRFSGARRLHAARAVGPFASHARRAWHPGALLVGDAADFFDPFTGEGIYSALRGGELVAATAMQALGAPSRRMELEALGAYDARRRAEFGGKWRVERLIGAGVAIPFVANRVVARLQAHKPLADLLVGVTGDFVPPREVLRASYLARLFLSPVSA